MFENFIDKLKKGYYKHGNTWEFDWYIDCFFVEVMAYGKYPIKLGYMQPIVGNEFLTFTYEKNIRNEYKDFFDNSDRVSKLIQDQNSIINSSDQLIENMKQGVFDFDRYEKVQKDLSLLMASVSVVFDPLISDLVLKISHQNKLPEDELIKYILENSNRTKLTESNEALFNIYKNNSDEINKSNFDFKKLSKQCKHLIASHKRNYGWINTGEKGANEWKEQDFLNQLADLVNKKVITRISSKKVREIRLVEDIISINTNDNIAADRQVELDYIFQTMLSNILGKYYISQITDNLTYQEIKEVTAKPKSIFKFDNRRDNTLRIVWPENYQVHYHYFKTEYEYKKVTNLIQTKENISQEIKGAVASRGVVQGIVKIVRTQEDLAQFEKGLVMVAEKTQPKYVTAMNRAIAIVTDMGGITSHAAIISREFGIPCIVGTKNATLVLKDGDRVIVDAEQGIVTKI